MPSLNNVRLGVRIGAILGVLVIAAVGATALLSADVQSDLVSRFGERQLQTLSRRFQAQIDDQAQRAVDMASLVASIPDVQKAFAAQDRDRLRAMFLPGFARMKKEHGAEQFQFHLPPATSFYRVHKDEKFGDDLSSFRRTVVAANQTQKTIKGVEKGVAGIGVRGVVPVFDGQKHIGTVEFGMSAGQALFDVFKEQSGAEVALYVETPDGFKAIGSTFGSGANFSDDVLRAGLNGTTVLPVRDIGGVPYALLTTPLLDYSGNAAGALVIATDQSAFYAELAAAKRNLMIVGLAVLAVALIGGLVFSRSITGCIRRLADATQSLADGDTQRDVPGLGRGDELGLIARALDSLKGSVDEAFRLKQMVDHQPARVMMCDPEDLRITYVNESALELLRRMEHWLPCKAEEVLGRSVASFHRDATFVKQVLGNPDKLPYHGKFRMGDLTIENTVIGIYDRSGAYVGPMLNWTDVSAYVRLADDFESRVKAVAESVGAAAAQLRESAAVMSQNTEATSHDSEEVVRISDQATANVETVAAATEELSNSIQEISQSLGRATQISTEAVRQVEATNATVEGLAAAAQRIGEVVNLITDIASQTNLLALNATIEAARAGDAGKGFAVVANEVKNLASQTSRATEDISQQIRDVQQATQEAVEAMRGIGDVIGQINEIATSIAAAVEEQGAATQEIARNVEEAAEGTRNVSATMQGLNDNAHKTGTAAAEVLTAADRLHRESGGLGTEVHEFLQKMQA